MLVSMHVASTCDSYMCVGSITHCWVRNPSRIPAAVITSSSLNWWAEYPAAMWSSFHLKRYKLIGYDYHNNNFIIIVGYTCRRPAAGLKLMIRIIMIFLVVVKKWCRLNYCHSSKQLFPITLTCAFLCISYDAMYYSIMISIKKCTLV